MSDAITGTVTSLALARQRRLRDAPPRFVALCGAPGAGKDTVADMLRARYGAQQVIDGYCLRTAAMALYDLTEEQVWTQTGKASRVTVCGQEFTVRQLLGDLGKMLEKKHGAQFIPEQAVNGLLTKPLTEPFYVFSSVRMNQGLTYIKNNGIVVEITRPGCEPQHDFDYYDKSLVSYTIVNDDASSDWSQALEHKVAAVFDPIFGEDTLAAEPP